MRSRGLLTFLVRVRIGTLNRSWHFKQHGGGGWGDLNVHNFITAIVPGRSLTWSLIVVCVFKSVLTNDLNLCSVAHPWRIYSDQCLAGCGGRASATSWVCERVFRDQPELAHLLLSSSVGWHWKAFADSQGSLSAYLRSKTVVALEWKQSGWECSVVP